MMDNGQPDQKRPRIGSWNGQQSRELPQLPPPAAPFQHGSPFSRPDPQQHPLDNRRRHSEHGQYDPDQRGPSSGPSHGYRPNPQHPSAPPPYSAPRDTMIKRDPSDEPPVQQYRPPSTGNGPDHGLTVPLPDRFHHPQFDPSPPGPAAFRPPYPPPQSPMSGPESYAPYNGFPSQARDSYQTLPYSSSAAAANSIKRKAQRAAQACDSCRTLKAKCDEGRPNCGSCKEKGATCVYRDPPPKQVDKASADIMESLMRLETAVKGIEDKLERRVTGLFDNVSRRVGILEKVVVSHVPDAETSLKQEHHDNVQLPQYDQPPVSSQSPPPSATSEPVYPTTPSQYKAIERTEEDQNDVEEEEAGDPVPPGKTSIPVNHTTPAARLLLVQPIAQLASGIIAHERIRNEKYPMIQEERRGLLRLFGRGEGLDRPPGYEKDPLTDYGSESTPSDTNSDVSSPAGEEWGQVGGLTPVAEDNSPPVQRGTVIDTEGMPDFRRETVWRYVESYKRNLNNMHPILIPRHLNALVENFLKTIPASYAKPRQVENLAGQSSALRGPTASFVGSSSRNPESPGQKRKRSPVTMTDSPEVPSLWELKPGHPFRSIGTALVLLVLALGEICEHTKKLPDILPYQNDDQSIAGSPQMRNGHPRSPAQTSPTLSTPSGLPSPQEGDRIHSRSRRTSLEGAPFFTKTRSSRAKNLDVLPGLPYFAIATDIIGNQLGGNSLQHVHANILAGLYHGQLGRVLESHTYIHSACRGLQAILRPKLDRLQKLKKSNKMIPSRDNPIVFAFWTCLQLESDILAELPCPHSGILTLEEDMPPPNLQAAQDIDGIDQIVLESYSAQLYLRKHLNMLHNMFYNPEDDQGDKPIYLAMVQACEQSLSQIDIIAPNLKWDENGENATEILGARLRAKFYGARVITYRDFVLKILQRPAEGPKARGQQITNEFMNFDLTGSSIDAEIDPIIIQYAEQCIKALIKSTQAFHGLGDPGSKRLIVTNIWGTAHAQWGNVLTLQAAYMDPILKQFVDPGVLKELLIKTLAFLWLHSQRSSALYIDYKILQHTGRATGMLLDNDQVHSGSVSSSFGSQSSRDVTMT